MSDASLRRVARIGLAPLVESVPEGPLWEDVTSDAVLGPVGQGRWRQPWLIGAASAIVVGAVFGAAALIGSAPSNPPTSSIDTPWSVFVPPTRIVGEETFLDLTLLDGSRITLAYPSDVDLTSKGLDAQTVGGLGAPNRSVEVFNISPEEFVARNEEFGGPAVLTDSFTGPDGGVVERWEFSGIPYLVFDFEPWTAAVWDTEVMVASNVDGWIESLHGTLDAQGFLILDADPPLELVPAGEDPGPDGPDIRVEGESGSLLVFIDECDRTTQRSSNYGSDQLFVFCDEDSNTLFFVGGTGSFQRTIHESLRVNPEVPSPTTTTQPGTTSTTTPVEPWSFVPVATVTEDQTAVLPVAFMNGATATLTWPASLDLLSNGVQTSGWGAVNDLGSNSARDILAIPEPRDLVIDRFGTGDLLDTYPDGAGGVVEFRRFPSDTTVDYLVYEFGEWTVMVYDYQSRSAGRVTESSREVWSSSLSGSVTPAGFLTLNAEPPLILAGSDALLSPVSLTLNPPNEGPISLRLRQCEPGEILDDEPNSLSWCSATGAIEITAYTINVDFRNTVREELTISEFSPAP